jgi:hypothetical protein
MIPTLTRKGFAAFVTLAGANADWFATDETDARRVSVAALRASRRIRPNPSLDISVGRILVVGMLSEMKGVAKFR